jgi:hypothetical protein
MRTATKVQSSSSTSAAKAAAILRDVTSTPPRMKLGTTHKPAGSFTPGRALPVSLTVDSNVTVAEFFYRHVNQGERWNSLPMTKSSNGFVSAIPGDYTKSVYPLQYYFVVRRGEASSYHPEFNETLSNEPYFSVWRHS